MCIREWIIDGGGKGEVVKNYYFQLMVVQIEKLLMSVYDHNDF